METGGPPVLAGPRIWTVFALAAVLLGATILSQAVLSVGVLIWEVAHGMDVETAGKELLEALAKPGWFMLLAGSSQLVMGVGVVLAATLSPRATLDRLGLRRPLVAGWTQPVLMIGALFPLSVGVSLAILLAEVIPPDPFAERLYEQMTPGWAVPFILFIAISPGFVEELLFRGYLQTRLLERWRPLRAILISSGIFAVFHITPHAVVNAFVIGLWLGVLAWRTGSVWSGILCHAFINGSWNIWHVGVQVWGFPERPPLIPSLALAVIVLFCFVLSIRILWATGGATAEAARRSLDPAPGGL